MAMFSIKDLTFTYTGCDKSTLNKLNLDIERGSFVVICGKSGSGKSTLLRLMKMQVAPKGNVLGEILYNGLPLDKLDTKQSVSDIGYIYQDVENQLVCDKVWKELAFGLGNLGYNDEYIASRIAEVCEYFGISKWYNKKVCELSGGSKQIVSLASLMTMNPKILLLDEPTSMLDPIAKKNFVGLLSRINRELGVTIVMVEHNMESVFDIADKIVVLDSGSVVCIEEPNMISSKLKNTDYIKYLGLTEFAEIFASVCDKENMPFEVAEKKEWLKQKLATFKDSDVSTAENDDKNDIVLTAHNLCFRYDKKSEDVVKSANLQLKKSEVLCLLGGNGGGKTTFINLLSGTLKAYSGKIKVCKDCRLAVLPQYAKGLFTESSVYDELMFFAKLLKVDKKILFELIEKFDLQSIKDNHPYDISGGEVQRLALAKVFMTNPNILILDEPTQGMDMHSKEYLKDLLLQSKKDGKSIILVTHDLRFASEVSDRMGIFFDGKILSLSKTEDFFASNNLYTTESSFLTRDISKSLYSVDRVVQAISYNKSN